MIDASQMRAARGLLEWSQTQLAEASGLSLPTIKRMEKVGPGRSSADNVKAVIDALQSAGVILIPENGEGRGVRLRKERPHTASFRAFIMRSPITNDPEGDFIRDARADPQMPDAKEWQEVLSYLERLGAGERVILAGKGAWERYLADKLS